MSKKKAMFFKQSGGGVDTDYLAILDEATTLYGSGSLPSAGDQTIQNQMVIDAKASGVWNTIDLLYIFTGSGGADFKKINWKNPTGVKIVEVNSTTSPTYSSTGVQQPTGRSRLALGYTYLELTNYLQNSASYFLDAISAGTSSFTALGSRDSGDYNYVSIGNLTRPAINNTSVTPPNIYTFTSGLVGVHRSSATDVQFTQDAVEVVNGTANPSDVKENSEIFILGRQVGSISAALGFDGEIGFFAIGGYMKNDTQNLIDAFRV